jgi:hypothetical protein
MLLSRIMYFIASIADAARGRVSHLENHSGPNLAGFSLAAP